MIPKLIHLCWFSGDEYPEDIKFCLDSWKKVLPDFQIKLWTKEMALATGFDFVREAISVKKWAFAADVIRLYAVYHDGGVYMDSDIYVQKRFDVFLERRCAFFQEYHPIAYTAKDIDKLGNRLESVKSVQGMGIQAALFMAEKGNAYIKELLDDYKERHFILDNGTYNMNSVLAPALYARNAEKYGYKYLNVEQHLSDDLDVYPSDFVASSIPLRKSVNFAIHCIKGSWWDTPQKQNNKKKPLIIRMKTAIYSFGCKLIRLRHKEPTTFKEKLEAHSVRL